MVQAGEKFGIVSGDITSRSMGANGEDVMFSPFATRVYGNIAIECKAVESLNVAGTFFEHAAKYPKSEVALVHKRSRQEPLCTIRLSSYVELLRKNAQAKLLIDNKASA